VAVAGRRRRARRHARVRGDIHPEPAAADRDEAGHAAAPGHARRRLRLRALQREPQARTGVGEELRTLLPRRHAGVQRRPERLPPADDAGVVVVDCSSTTGTYGIFLIDVPVLSRLSGALEAGRE